MRYRKLMCGVLCVSLLSGCSQASLEAQYPKTVRYDENNYEAWQKNRDELENQYPGYNEGMDVFYQTICRNMFDTQENRTVSPLNLYMALSMCASMTDGRSRQQILSVLNTDEDKLEEKAHALWLANYADDGIVTCTLNNSLWLNEEASYKDSLLSKMKDEYYASIYKGKMGSGKFNEKLRAWVNEHTGNMLANSVKGMELEPDQFMSILSTLYYKGAWIDEFDKENNTEEIFHGINGDQKTEFMNQTLQTLYVDAKEYEAVGLGIEHSGTFWIVLPKKDMASVWEDIEKPTGEMMEVNLSMPKFDIENTLSLKDTLKKMGMSDVFDPEKADFAPLTDTPVYLSEVEHGVRVKTDEKGIEAAAYTKMDIDAMALIQESVDFKVDRPFIFAVQSQDGSILFCGQVTELS